MVLEARKSKIKMWASLVPDEGPLPGWGGWGEGRSLFLKPL